MGAAGPSFKSNETSEAGHRERQHISILKIYVVEASMLPTAQRLGFDQKFSLSPRFSTPGMRTLWLCECSISAGMQVPMYSSPAGRNASL